MGDIVTCGALRFFLPYHEDFEIYKQGVLSVISDLCPSCRDIYRCNPLRQELEGHLDELGSKTAEKLASNLKSCKELYTSKYGEKNPVGEEMISLLQEQECEQSTKL